MTRRKQRSPQTRQIIGRRRPDFDRLEYRLAMSGATVGLAAIASSGGIEVSAAADPAGTALVVTPPASGIPGTVSRTSDAISLTFAGPIDSFSYRGHDFELDRIFNDGTISRPIVLNEALDSNDPTGSRIVLGLDQPLVAGQYRLLLLSKSPLRLDDGTTLAGGDHDIPLNDFTIAARDLGLAGATDLGTPTSDVAVRSDVLDLSSDPGAFKVYKVSLPEGHFWRLGLEISALSDGGSLASELSLFDSNGRLISTASHGRGDVASDPYLYSGLGAGTYYVAVSGAGVVPGASTTAAPTAPSLLDDQPGGPFQLSFVADQADQATRALQVRADLADPESLEPTGLTVRFSGPIQLNSINDSSRPVAELIDAQGQSWTLIPSAYDEANAELSFLFNKALPTGHYTLALASSGALTDLAGLAPVASGQPSGVLGTIDIVRAPLAEDDLGTLFPGGGPVAVAPTALAPGDSIVQHFTVIQSGEYYFRTQGTSTGLQLYSSPSAPSPPTAIGLASGPAESHAYLVPGTYSIVLANDGSTPTEVAVRVRQEATPAVSFLESGVAQGPALSLRAIAPPADVLNATAASSLAAPAGSAPTAASGQGDAPRAAGVSGTGSTTAAPATPSASFFLVGNTVGHPGSQSDQIGSVGPAGGSLSISLASNSDALPAGLITPAGKLPRVLRRRSKAEIPVIAPESTPLEADEAVGVASDLASAGDRRALAKAAWLDGVVAWALDRFESSPNAPIVADAETSVAEAAPGSDAAPMEEEPRAELASLASPLAFGILGMIAIRRKQARRGNAGVAASPAAVNPPRPLLAGPHMSRARSLARR